MNREAQGETYSNIDHVDDEIRQLPRIVGRQIVATALYEQQLTLVFCMERLESPDVSGDVFTDSSVWTAAGFDRKDTFRRESMVFDEEFLIFTGEYIVGYYRDVEFLAQFLAESEQ